MKKETEHEFLSSKCVKVGEVVTKMMEVTYMINYILTDGKYPRQYQYHASGWLRCSTSSRKW